MTDDGLCGECGHDDNEHVHYCSHDERTGSCDCNAEYARVVTPANLRMAIGTLPALESNGPVEWIDRAAVLRLIDVYRVLEGGQS